MSYTAAAVSAATHSLVVLSDLHLSHRGSTAASEDVARLMQSEAMPEYVFAGDIFNLSTDPCGDDPGRSVAALLDHHSDLADAWREQLSSGRRLTLIAGNHDGAAASPRVREAMLETLRVNQDALLTISPWFVRRGTVHIEHGHLYDPDNAPAHPLAHWSEFTEPLGVALTRRFLAPAHALEFVHQHETTPLGGLARAFRIFGPRAPYLIVRYFATAIRICAQAGHRHNRTAFELEREAGTEALQTFAREVGLDEKTISEIVETLPDPTREEFWSIFMRLYFDRVIATLTFAGGGIAALAGVTPLGAVATAASGAYLLASVRGSGNRYRGLPEQRLQDAAAFIADTTGAQLVIFGHTHREDAAPRYLNTGSFAYFSGRGRPYVRIDESGCAERRRFAFA